MLPVSPTLEKSSLGGRDARANGEVEIGAEPVGDLESSLGQLDLARLQGQIGIETHKRLDW